VISSVALAAMKRDCRVLGIMAGFKQLREGVDSHVVLEQKDVTQIYSQVSVTVCVCLCVLLFSSVCSIASRQSTTTTTTTLTSLRCIPNEHNTCRLEAAARVL
jgi:hypothetical protein